MRKFFKLAGLFLLFGMLGLSYWIWRAQSDHPSLNDPKANILTGIIGSSESAQAFYLIFIHKQKPYLHVYQIPQGVKTQQGPVFVPADIKKTGQAISRLLNLRIDFHLDMRRKDILAMLDVFGGVEFFNLNSSFLPKGRVFIDSLNYYPFLEGIEEKVVLLDTAYSIWCNLIGNAFSFYIKFSDSRALANLLYSHVNTDLSKKAFIKLIVRYCSDDDKAYLSYSRMNLVSDENGIFPLEMGRFDQNKLVGIFEEFENKDKSIERFPIILQVKNSTSISRLAAKTAGVLRLKKCDVKEYLNSAISVNHSLILDRCGSSIKREYLKKITRIDDVYYLIDHREDFDFTLYLGDDYYGVKYFR